VGSAKNITPRRRDEIDLSRRQLIDRRIALDEARGGFLGRALARPRQHRARDVETERLALRSYAVGEFDGRRAASAADVQDELPGPSVSDGEQAVGDRPEDRLLAILEMDPTLAGLAVPIV
jgi:hypothetical protein